MTKAKQLIFLLLLFIVVGIAAVSTNVIINGTTQLASNPDDFNVYFSNVLVNGAQDLSLVQSETSLVFTGEFSAVGDKKEITYDVTNASKNYDADIDITCTQSTEYLTITNNFDVDSHLSARSTRSGVLTITLSKSYTGADLTQNIMCSINASAVERTSQSGGSVASPLENQFYVGKEISIGEEKFNVISVDDDTVTMLAQYKIIYDPFKQSVNIYYNVEFSYEPDWEYTPGPKEIDFEVWSYYADYLINGYETYLKNEYNVDVIGDLITLKELDELGCTVPTDYSSDGVWTCEESEYSDWLVNGQGWWTRSASSTYSNHVWVVQSGGQVCTSEATDSYAIRPVITISKEALENLD